MMQHNFYTKVKDGQPGPVYYSPVALADEELAGGDIVKVEVPEYPVDGYLYELGAASLVDGVWVAQWEQKDTPDRERIQTMLATRRRMDRDSLLAKCDWTQIADVPLTEEQKTAWKAYRQALRDVTSQPGFPWRVDWPTAPT